MKSLKELIKQLANSQKSLKIDRKTVNHPWPAKRKQKPGKAADMVQENKVRITAALNLYHRVRDTDHSHGLNPHNAYAWKYTHFFEELEKLYCVEKPVDGTPA